MSMTRAGFLRGAALSSLLLPGVATTIASAKPAPQHGVEFVSDIGGNGPHPWTDGPGLGPVPLRFVVIGDRTGLARPGVFERAMMQIRLLAPDFVLSVGDLIEGYTQDQTEIARQWAEVDAAIATCGVPFVFTPGNHDIDNAETLQAWKTRRGAGHYSFVCRDALFLVLNTENTPTPMPDKLAQQFNMLVRMMHADPERTQKGIVDRISQGTSNAGEYNALETASFGDAQLEFVRTTLARHTNVRWTFVVMHKPAWKKEFACFSDIQAMLKGRPHTVIAGHTHYFTHEVIAGADYINMATTGGIFSLGNEDGKPLRLQSGTMDHVLLVNMTTQGPDIANLRLTGMMDTDGKTGQTLAY